MSNSELNVTLPAIHMVPPNQLDAYIIVARDLLPAIEALSNVKNIHPRGCALIAAHVLECSLKAFLWHKGKKDAIFEQKNRHNLVALWEMAYNENNLDIQESPPNWVKTLSIGHGPNFYFRYQEGKKKENERGKVVVNCGSYPP